MWQFAETVRGLADGCLEMGLPVTGGNVSFYNQTGDVAILPTPVIGVLGVIQDVRTRTPMGFDVAGLDLFLLGETQEDFAGSEWAYMHGERGGIAPTSDLQREMRLIDALLEGQPVFEAAHDLSQGGLAASLAEMVLRHNIGATVLLEGEISTALLSETPGRVVVAIKTENVQALQKIAESHDIPLSKIGYTGGTSLVINDADIALDDLRMAYMDTIPRLFG